MLRGFKKIYKRHQVPFLWDEEYLPGKINADLWNKIRDASKGDDHSTKLVPKS